MSLELILLIAGVALVAGGSVSLRGSTALTVRAVSASALAAGTVLLLIGLVNVLSVS